MADKGDSKADKARILELEKKLKAKEEELGTFQSEVKRLNIELEKVIHQINQDIRLTHLIQKALVPTDIPNFPGFDLSSKFLSSAIRGGDYFDFFSLDDRLRFGLLMSTSSGHAMSALFLSVLFRMLTQPQARKSKDPSDFLSMMMKDLESHLNHQENISLICGVLDRKVYEFVYCLQGNIGFFHWNADKKQVTQLPATGAPLAYGNPNTFRNSKCALSPRDRLIFCSEGVLQMQNAAGEFFGSQKLMNLIEGSSRLSPHELRNEILFQLQRFVGSTDLNRDATVLVVEVKDNVIRLHLEKE